MFPRLRALRALAALLLAAAAAPQSTPEPPPATIFEPEAARRWIPFEWEPGNVIVIPVLLDGKPARALVDTGFPGVTLARAYARAQRLPLTEAGHSYSVGGLARIDQAPAPLLEFGGIRASGGTMRVMDLSGLDNFVGKPIDVVIGASLLGRYALQIDFDARRLRLLPAGTRALVGTDIPVTMTRTPRILVPTRLGPAGGKRAPLPLMIDLGSVQNLSLAADVPLPPGRRTTDSAAIGAGGLAISKLVTLDRVAFGPAASANVLTAIEGSGAFLKSNGLRGLVGLGLLSRYNLVLDATHRRLTLAPRLSPNAEPARSTTGIQGDPRDDRVDILHVMAGSPAVRAGLKAGDAICAINGTRLTPGWRTGPFSHWGIAPPGTRYDIGLCTGRTVPLVTAAFY